MGLPHQRGEACGKRHLLGCVNFGVLGERMHGVWKGSWGSRISGTGRLMVHIAQSERILPFPAAVRVYCVAVAFADGVGRDSTSSSTQLKAGLAC